MTEEATRLEPLAPNLKISYKKDQIPETVMGKYLREVNQIIKSLIIKNELLAEQETSEMLASSMTADSGKELSLISALNKKINVLLEMSEGKLTSKSMSCSPRLLVTEVADLCNVEIKFDRTQVLGFYIRVDHEMLISSFVSIIEALGEQGTQKVTLAFMPKGDNCSFVFKGGSGILTDSLNGLFALELLKNMGAQVKWTSGKVNVLVQNAARWTD